MPSLWTKWRDLGFDVQQLRQVGQLATQRDDLVAVGISAVIIVYHYSDDRETYHSNLLDLSLLSNCHHHTLFKIVTIILCSKLSPSHFVGKFRQGFKVDGGPGGLH